MSKRIDLEQLYRTDPQRACRLALRRALATTPNGDGWPRQKPDNVLRTSGEHLDIYGQVEAILTETWHGGYYGYISAIYVNVGDSYACTMLYDVRLDRYLVTSWGDWLESEERQGRGNVQ